MELSQSRHLLRDISRLYKRLFHLAHLPSLHLGRRRRFPTTLALSQDIVVDVRGFPGDSPSDVPTVLSVVARLLHDMNVRWCVAGDVLLNHYCVPKVTGDIEICLPPDEVNRVHDALKNETEFCHSFRPQAGKSTYHEHLARYPRLKVRGMNQCIYLFPCTLYGLQPTVFTDLINLPELLYPLLPLPHYIRGLATVIDQSGPGKRNSLMQLEFLIDGMDIDERWCQDYLETPLLEIVKCRSTEDAKKRRMGSHPKYEGNITTYIRNNVEHKAALNCIGRTIQCEEIVPSGMTQNATLQGSSEETTEALSVQLMSDLHLELSFKVGEEDHYVPGYEAFHVIQSSPHLALLGDIGQTAQDGLFDFLQQQLLKYKKVFFVMGNHEYYGSSHDRASKRMEDFVHEMKGKRSICTSLGEFIWLNRTRHDLSDEVTVLGCTLWSHIPTTSTPIMQLRFNDFKRIQQWSVEAHNEAHRTDVEWLDRQVTELRHNEPHRRIIIFTHHSPLIEGTSGPQYANSPVSCGFSTDLTVKTCWDPDAVSVWAFGHTHFNCDFRKDGIRVMSNQRGYEGIESLKTGFNDKFVMYL